MQEEKPKLWPFEHDDERDPGAIDQRITIWNQLIPIDLREYFYLSAHGGKPRCCGCDKPVEDTPKALAYGAYSAEYTEPPPYPLAPPDELWVVFCGNCPASNNAKLRRLHMGMRYVQLVGVVQERA